MRIFEDAAGHGDMPVSDGHRMQMLAAAATVALLAGTVAGYCMVRAHYASIKAAAVFPDPGRPASAGGPELPTKTHTRIILFGDSRIAQWRDFPRAGETEVVNRGVGGETTAQMRLRFERDILAARPDIVVLQLGINDLVAIGLLPDRQQEIVRQCTDNMRYFVATLQANGIKTVLLTIIPPAFPPLWRLPFWSGRIPEEVERLNREWLSARRSPGLRVVDSGAVLKDGQGHWRDGVVADTLHLTPRGYELLNAELVPLLRELE